MLSRGNKQSFAMKKNACFVRLFYAITADKKIIIKSVKVKLNEMFSKHAIKERICLSLDLYRMF